MKKRLVVLLFALTLMLCACGSNEGSSTSSKESLSVSSEIEEVTDDTEKVDETESEAKETESEAKETESEDKEAESKEETSISEEISVSEDVQDDSGEEEKRQGSEEDTSQDGALAAAMETNFKTIKDVLYAYVNGDMADDLYEDIFYVDGLYPIFSPDFAIVDLNMDGRDDLLVNGIVGIRSLEETQVFISLEDKVVAIDENGYLDKCYDNIYVFSADDHDITSMYTYKDREGVSFDEKGNALELFSTYECFKWGDPDTMEEYEEPVTETAIYRLKGTECSLKEIEDYYASFKESSLPVFYPLNAENLAKVFGE